MDTRAPETQAATGECGGVREHGQSLAQSMSEVLVRPLIIQGLKEKIRTKRLLEGAEEIHVHDTVPKVYPLTLEEEINVAIRKERNIKSANKSRLKRKTLEIKLKQDVKALTADNEELLAVVEKWRTTKESMEQILKSYDGHICKANRATPLNIARGLVVASSAAGGKKGTAITLDDTQMCACATAHAGRAQALSERNKQNISWDGDKANTEEASQLKRACSFTHDINESNLCAKRYRASEEEAVARLEEYLKDDSCSPCDVFYSAVEINNLLIYTAE